MLSFLTRRSLILPLLCALTVGAKLYTIKSVKNDLIVARPHEEGHDVKIVSDKRVAAALIIEPPLHDPSHGPKVIYDKDADLYIGVRRVRDDSPYAKPTLAWATEKYEWRVAKAADDKYVLSPYYHVYPPSFWYDNNDESSVIGNIQLKEIDAFVERERYLWDIEEHFHH